MVVHAEAGRFLSLRTARATQKKKKKKNLSWGEKKETGWPPGSPGQGDQMGQKQGDS